MPVMNSVGSDFAKFIKSFPVQTDHNAKEVIEWLNFKIHKDNRFI